MVLITLSFAWLYTVQWGVIMIIKNEMNTTRKEAAADSLSTAAQDSNTYTA